MAFARTPGLVRILQNAVKKPAKIPKRKCGYIHRPTESVKEAAHECYIGEYTAETKAADRDTLIFGVPFVLIVGYLGYATEEHHDGRPRYMPFDYMYRRKHPFKWGDGNHTLLHHPECNPLPDGYEDGGQ